MTNLLAKLHARVRNDDARGDRGAATMEYGLAAVLVGVTLVAATTLFGGDIGSW